MVKTATLLLAGCLVALIGTAPQAEARYITIESRVTPTIDGDHVRMLVSIANRGDEPAHQVSARVEIEGVEEIGTTRDILPPDEGYIEQLTLPVQFAKPGRYPVVVAIDYTDGNGYPFTAISMADVAYGESVAGRVVAELAPEALRGDGSIRVTVTNLGQTDERLRVRLVTPTEIVAAPAIKELTLKPGKEKAVTFKVHNDSALTGSHYQIYAIVSYEDERYRFTNISGGALTVAERKAAHAPYGLSAIAVAVLAGLIFGYVNIRKAVGRRHAT